MMDLLEDSFSLLKNTGARSSMALGDESFRENVQELLKLLSAIRRHSTESQVEEYMSQLRSLLADSFDDEVDVVVEALETGQALATVLSAMKLHFRNFKIQLHGCYVLLRLVELSPRIKGEFQGKPDDLKFLLQIMSKYADKTCQVVGCKIISNLCTSTRTRRDAVSNGAVGSVLYAISQFGEEEEFYIPAFEALTCLLADDLKVKENFMNMDVQNSRKKAYRMLVDIMEKYTNSGKLFLILKKFPFFLER